jgi:transcription elongation GreA/GreB family factor
MDEVASALGLTPEELENYAKSDKRGNLAGILMLREQGGQMSPRMAGAIAGTEDRLTQLESKVKDGLSDFDNKFLDILDGHDSRLRKLEDVNGIKSPPKSGALADLERRMNNIAKEDLGDSTSGKRNLGQQSPTAKTASSLAQGGTGGTNASLANESQQEVFGEVADEIKRLSVETDEIKARLKMLDSALEALRAGSPPEKVKAQLGPPRVDTKGGGAELSAVVKAAEEYAQRGETSAQAATLAAEECQRLKDELAEIVNAVNVPSVGLEDSFFDGKPPDGDDLDIDDDVRDDAARQYMERQGVMEARLKQLEEQLDTASVVMPESEIFSSLKAVIKDVRRCLSRCELLYQLPEIKAFVKRFQRSLEVNAILHEKWVGPGAGKRSPAPEEMTADQDRLSHREHGEDPTLTRDSEQSRSAPDLRSKRGAGATGKGNEKQKKKPFRTVVDWCRPHTPLKIDPMFKGGASQPAGERGGSRSEDRPHLPQIK